MLKPAFSTVASPNWTLREVAQSADEMGYEAVELRTFGDDSREFACDPALTSPEKTRELFASRGVEIACLATSLRFDQIIGPPVLGPALWDQDRMVREAGRVIDLAASLECPFVRVFGFQLPEYDKRKTGLRRVSERLLMAADKANRTGVRIVVENGGSFGTAAQLKELLDACAHPLIGACYSNAAATIAGEDPEIGIDTLQDKLWVARVHDAKPSKAATHKPDASHDLHLEPCPLGEGHLKAELFTRTLSRVGFEGPLVYDLPLAWCDPGAQPRAFLEPAARTMFEWASNQRLSREAVTPAPSVRAATPKARAR